jgi:hypothetical protein
LFRRPHEDGVAAWSWFFGMLGPRSRQGSPKMRINCASSSVEGYNALLSAAAHGEGRGGGW